MTEYEEHLLAAEEFFVQASCQFKISINDVCEIYDNFELIENSFAYFGCPEFRTYTEMRDVFCSLGASDLEFDDPASLFNNFVNLVVLNGVYDGCSGLKGFEVFTSNAEEYNEHTLNMCLHKCFPSIKAEIGLSPLENYRDCFSGIFMPIFKGNEEVYVLYELCFLYWFICCHGPMTRHKIIANFRIERIRAYEEKGGLLKLEFRKLQTFFQSFRKANKIKLDDSDSMMIEAFIQVLDTYSNIEFRKMVENCFQIYSEVEQTYFLLSGLEAENMESTVFIDEAFELAKDFLNAKQKFYYETLNQLVSNIFASNVTEELEFIIAGIEVDFEEPDDDNILTKDQIVDYLELNVLGRIRHHYICEFVDLSSEILKNKCCYEPSLHMESLLHREELFGDISNIFKLFLTEQTIEGNADFAKIFINFEESLFLNAISQHISRSEKRNLAEAFLDEFDSYEQLIATIPPNDRDIFQKKIGELEEISNTLMNNDISESSAYTIQYNNRASLVHDVLIREFLKFISLLCDENSGIDIEHTKKDIIKIFVGEYERPNSVVGVADALEQLGENMKHDCFAGDRIIRLSSLHAPEYSTSEVNEQLSLLEELEHSIIISGGLPPSNHLSLGFLRFLKAANTSFETVISGKRNIFVQLHETHKEHIQRVKQLFQDIINTLETVEKDYQSIESTIESETSKDELEAVKTNANELLQRIGYQSQMSGDFENLFNLIFEEYPAESYFSVETYVFCLWMTIQLRKEWDRLCSLLYSKYCIIEEACNTIDIFEKVIFSLSEATDNINRFSEFVKKLESQEADEETYTKCCKEFSRVGATEILAELVDTFRLNIEAEFPFTKEIIIDLITGFMTAAKELEFIRKRFIAAAMKFETAENKILLCEDDLEMLEQKVIEVENKFTEFTSRQGSAIMEHAFELIGLEGEIEAYIEVLENCICDAHLKMTIEQLNSIKEAVLAVFEIPELQNMFERFRDQLDSRDKCEERVARIYERAQQLQKCIRESYETAYCSVEEDLASHGSESHLEQCFNLLQGTVGKFAEMEHCTFLCPELQYLLDCVNLYLQQYQVFNRLELDDEEELSKGERCIFDELEDILAVFIQSLYSISNIGLTIKLKKAPTREDILIMKQIAQYLPFLEEMCELIRNMSTKTHIDQEVKVLLEEFGIEFTTIYIHERPENYDLLEETMSNLNQIKMFGSIQLGELTGVVEQYLTEDVVFEFEHEKELSFIAEELVIECREVVVNDYVIFGLSEIVYRAARTEHEFIAYHDQVSEFSSKEFPEIAAQLHPLELNEEIEALLERTCHLEQKALMFDRNCKETIEKLFKGDTKIEIASSESYDRREEYAPACGSIGYPRQLILCLHALLESRKHVDDREARNEEQKRQICKDKQEIATEARERAEHIYTQFLDLREYPILDDKEEEQLQSYILSMSNELFVIMQNYYCNEILDNGDLLHDTSEQFEELCFFMQMQRDNAVRATAAGNLEAEFSSGESSALLGEAIRELIATIILNSNGVQTELPTCNIVNDIEYTALYERFLEFARELVRQKEISVQPEETHLYRIISSVEDFLRQAFERYAESSSAKIQNIVEKIVNESNYLEIYEEEMEYIKQQTELVQAVDHELERLIDLENSNLISKNSGLDCFSCFKVVFAKFLAIQCISKALREIIVAYVAEESDFYEIEVALHMLEQILEHHKLRFAYADTDVRAAKQVLSRTVVNIRRFVDITLADLQNKMELQAIIFSSSCVNIYQLYEEEFDINVPIMEGENEFAGNYIFDTQAFPHILSSFELLSEAPEPTEQNGMVSALSGMPLQSAIVKALFIANVFEKSKISSFKLPELPKIEFPFKFEGECHCYELKFLFDSCAKWTGHFDSFYVEQFVENEEIYASLMEAQRRLNGNEIVNEKLVANLVSEWENCSPSSVEAVRSFKSQFMQFVEKNSRLSLPCFKSQYINQLYSYLESLLELAQKIEYKLFNLERESKYKMLTAAIEGAIDAQADELENWIEINKQSELTHEIIEAEHSYLERMSDDFLEFTPDLKANFNSPLHFSPSHAISISKKPLLVQESWHKFSYKTILVFLGRMMKRVEPSEKILYSAFVQVLKRFVLDESLYTLLGGVEDEGEREIQQFITTLEELHRLENKIEPMVEQQRLKMEEEEQFAESYNNFRDEANAFSADVLSSALLLRCCSCLSGQIDEVDDHELETLENTLETFPILKEKMVLLVEKYEKVEINPSMYASFTASLDSEMFVGVSRSVCQIFEFGEQNRKEYRQEMLKFLESRERFENVLNNIPAIVEKLFNVSLSYTLEDNLANTDFSDYSFEPGFLNRESSTNTIIGIFEGIIRFGHEQYVAETEIRAHVKNDTPKRAVMKLSGEHIVDSVVKLISASGESIKDLHNQFFGLELLSSASCIITAENTLEFVVMLIKLVDLPFNAFKEAKWPLRLVCTFFNFLDRQQLNSIKREFEPLREEIGNITAILVEYEDFESEMNRLAERTADELLQIGYFEIVVDCVAGYSVAIGQFSRDSSLIQLEAQAELQKDFYEDSSLEEHCYLSIASAVLGEFIDRLHGLTVIDAFDDPLFPIPSQQTKFMVASNALFLSESAFTGTLGAIASGNDGIYDFLSAPCAFLEKSKLLFKIRAECVEVGKEHDLVISELEKRLGSNEEKLQHEFVNEIKGDLFESLFACIEKDCEVEGQQPHDMLYAEVAQDMMAHLFVVCGSCSRFNEQETDIERELLAIETRINEIQLLQSRTRTENLIEAYIAAENDVEQ